MSFQLVGDGPEIYESTMVPLWFGRWAKELVDLVPLAPGARVLDVACGTGVTTRLVKREVGDQGRVVGLDINAGMLARAERLSSGLGIEWMESDVGEIALPSQSFDAVISQHGYHYFPDKPGALKEFHRLLVPSGRIALSIWDGHSAYTAAICKAVAAHISPEIAAKQHAQRVTPTAEALIEQLSSAGFRDVEVVRQELLIEVPRAAEFVPLHLSSMPIAAAFHGLEAEAKNALIEDVGAAMETYVRGDGLAYPDAVHVVRGLR